MPPKTSISPRRYLAALASTAAVALTVMAGGAGSAAAAPLHASFDDAAVGNGSPDGSIDLLEPPSQASLQGDVTGGAVTIPSPSGLSFPSSSGSFMGINMSFSFAPTGTADISGTLTGGELSLASHSYRATVSVSGGPACTYDVNLPFGTANPSGGPFNGDVFTTGSPDTTLTQGGLEAHWTSLPPDPQPGCELANALVAAGRGFALSHGIDLPGTPLGPLSGGPPFAGDPTGERAAALRKCKKIKNQKKRRKCKRRARKLPV